MTEMAVRYDFGPQKSGEKGIQVPAARRERLQGIRTKGKEHKKRNGGRD